ncbi:MAG: hypothetical protein ACI90V_013184 [Bacillariaceae sp.]|jgi:hypothetical protein
MLIYFLWSIIYRRFNEFLGSKFDRQLILFQQQQQQQSSQYLFQGFHILLRVEEHCIDRSSPFANTFI